MKRKGRGGTWHVHCHRRSCPKWPSPKTPAFIASIANPYPVGQRLGHTTVPGRGRTMILYQGNQILAVVVLVFAQTAEIKIYGITCKLPVNYQCTTKHVTHCPSPFAIRRPSAQSFLSAHNASRLRGSVCLPNRLTLTSSFLTTPDSLYLKFSS